MKAILLTLLILPVLAMSQIEGKLLIGSWCVEKITNVPTPGQKEVLQTQMMDEFQGVIMLFSAEEYSVYLENSEDELTAKYEIFSRENKIKITYIDTKEIIEYKVEKLTKDEFVFIVQDEYGKHRFFLKPCN